MGTLTLTDNRLLFSSPTKSQHLSYQRIVSHRGGPKAIEIQVTGKPVWTFLLRPESVIPYAVFSACVASAFQTLVRNPDLKSSTRHIPRDVRQRVWQRYAGRCGVWRVGLP